MSKKALSTGSGHIAASFDAIYIGTSQTITTSGTSQQSSAVSANTGIVRLFCTQDVFIAISSNPTATSSTLFLPGGIVEYFACTGSDKVAAIQSVAAGTLYITEGSA